MSATATFTPQQVLDAGRRAETEGRRDYAIQFYRHLTDHWSETPEASAAREGLTRLGMRPLPLPAPALPYNPAMNGSANGAASQGAMPYMPASVPNASALPREQPATPAAQRASGPSRASHHAKYRAGRFVAGFIIGIGLISMVSGCALLALYAAAWFGKPVFKTMSVLGLQEPIEGVLLLCSGLFVMFIGQLAQAVFDGANAVRDLAQFEHERAKSRD
jgi:hypothetical protein